MKKIVVTLTFLLMLMPVVAKFSFSEFVTISLYSDGIKYTIDSDSTVKLVKYDQTKYAGDIVIPSTVVYAEDSFKVKSIESSSFSSCYGLKSIVLPPSIKLIGSFAFDYCTGLTSITLPQSITSIGEGAFGNCSSLTSIDIPENVRSIGAGTFVYCTGLTNVSIASSVSSIGNFAFEGCANLTSISIPQSVTSIGSYCFRNCIKLKTILNQSSITEIYQYAFSGCSSLTSINIPSSVTRIGTAAFYECTGLTTITIPMNVSYIDEFAFYYCSGLKEIHSQMKTPTSASYDFVFYAVNKSTCKLYVPKGSSSLYSQAYIWRGFKNIIEEDYTAVNEVDAADVAVYTSERGIVVKGAVPGETVAVYTVSGVLVKTVKADGEIRLQVPSGQIYLVKVGSKTYKVAL